MAVQNHLLSNTILIRPDDNDDSDSSLQGETMKVQVNTPFKYPYCDYVFVFFIWLSIRDRTSFVINIFTQQNLLVV